MSKRHTRDGGYSGSEEDSSEMVDMSSTKLRRKSQTKPVVSFDPDPHIAVDSITKKPEMDRVCSLSRYYCGLCAL